METTSRIEISTPFDEPLERPALSVLRIALFLVATFALSGAYFLWRPPLPMLFVKHSEILGRDTNQISLTIDDAPHPLSTPLLLASLQHSEVKASFFSVGEGLRLYPELAHRIVAEGHVLENHSQPHHNLTTVDPRTYASHIDACFEAIKATEQGAGVQRDTRLFRPPGGGYDRATMQYFYDNNVTLAWWSNNMGDWTCPPAWKIAREVKANLAPGDILLLHDGGTGTPQAIPDIVKEARSREMEFVVMPDKE